MTADDPAFGHLPIDPDLGPAAARWQLALVVAVGGALGGAARYGINQLWPDPPGFPWSTFVENVSGSLLLGVLLVLVVEVSTPHAFVRPFLGTGVLGGYTTFSAYTSDVRRLLADSQAATALVYLVASLVLGLLACWLGIVLTRRLANGRAHGWTP